MKYIVGNKLPSDAREALDFLSNYYKEKVIQFELKVVKIEDKIHEGIPCSNIGGHTHNYIKKNYENLFDQALPSRKARDFISKSFIYLYKSDNGYTFIKVKCNSSQTGKTLRWTFMYVTVIY